MIELDLIVSYVDEWIMGVRIGIDRSYISFEVLRLDLQEDKPLLLSIIKLRYVDLLFVLFDPYRFHVDLLKLVIMLSF